MVIESVIFVGFSKSIVVGTGADLTVNVPVHVLTAGAEVLFAIVIVPVSIVSCVSGIVTVSFWL